MRTYITILLIMTLSINCEQSRQFSKHTDRTRIKKELHTITREFGYRDYLSIKNLNKVANYIYQQFEENCDTVYYQKFQVNNVVYKNVVASLGTEHDKRIIVGAHYDACGKQEGADDNASGVVGVLELARLLSKKDLNCRIDFVAYTLEEPPFFDTNEMGSYIHAKSISDEKQDIIGMICLEMIGYYNDSIGSQDYPLSILKPFYGNKGDYITIVRKFGDSRFARRINKLLKSQKLIKTKTFKGPKALQGVDFSDHRNYWKFGYDAVMITNTAFYRNKNYHQITDKVETLDIERMSRVIDQVYLSLLEY